GYRGRVGIYEILLVSNTVRQQIVERINSTDIKLGAIERKEMKTLRMDGISKALDGLTTFEEVLRLTQADFV
ncbi:MAG: type II secretion system protein GspE, partial [Planctomycetes bacterium]|nr:type II secretion system protein GspE [Planctomycetota bacterium]